MAPCSLALGNQPSTTAFSIPLSDEPSSSIIAFVQNHNWHHEAFRSTGPCHIFLQFPIDGQKFWQQQHRSVASFGTVWHPLHIHIDLQPRILREIERLTMNCKSSLHPHVLGSSVIDGSAAQVSIGLSKTAICRRQVTLQSKTAPVPQPS